MHKIPTLNNPDLSGLKKDIELLKQANVKLRAEQHQIVAPPTVDREITQPSADVESLREENKGCMHTPALVWRYIFVLCCVVKFSVYFTAQNEK